MKIGFITKNLLQIMQENQSFLSDIVEEHVEATYLQKLLYGIIDTVIYLLLIMVIVKVLPREFLSIFIGRFKTYITVVIIMILYRMIFILVFGRTIAMAICKMKYLNRELKPLSLKERLYVSLPYKPASIKYYKD